MSPKKADRWKHRYRRRLERDPRMGVNAVLAKQRLHGGRSEDPSHWSVRAVWAGIGVMVLSWLVILWMFVDSVLT